MRKSPTDFGHLSAGGAVWKGLTNRYGLAGGSKPQEVSFERLKTVAISSVLSLLPALWLKM